MPTETDFNQFMKFFYSIKYVFIILILLYIFLVRGIDKLKVYTLCVWYICLFTTYFIFSLAFYISNFIKLKKSVNENTLKKMIKIYRIIYT